MSKKSKKKTRGKNGVGRIKALARRTGVIESRLNKLRRVSKKIITRQKKAKRGEKHLEKIRRLLKKRFRRVDTKLDIQRQRIRVLAKKNSALQTRLKKQAGIAKDNSARLNRFEPELENSRQQSQQLSRQIAGFLELTEQIKGRSDALEQGIASLELRVGKRDEVPAAAAERTDDNSSPAPLLAFGAPTEDTTDAEDEHQELLGKLQIRLDMLEDYCADLEEKNRQLGRTIDELADKTDQLDGQNLRLLEQEHSREAGQVEQQAKLQNQERQIVDLNDQIAGIETRLEAVTDGLQEAWQPSSRNKENERRLEKRINGLQQGLGELQALGLQLPGSLHEPAQRQLHESTEREDALRQQIDRLNELTAGTESKLSEQSDRFAREDSRLAELAQELEQRLAKLEETTTEQDQGLGGPDDEAQQKQSEIGDAEQALKAQIDHLGGLLVTTEGKLTEQNTRLAEEDTRLAEQAQHLERRLAKIEQATTPTQPEELQRLNGLGETAQRQLREIGDAGQALKQQVDHLGGLLVTTEGNLTEQNAKLAQEYTRLAEQVEYLEQRLAKIEGTTTSARPEEPQRLNGLGETAQQQLREIGEAGQVLKQQVDHLGGLLDTTDGKLSEQSAKLAQEDTRLAEQAQHLEQRLTRLEGTVDATLTQELQSLRTLSHDLQRQLQETSDGEQSLRQQIDHLGGLLQSTEEKLINQGSSLGAEDNRLEKQTQRLEQRLTDFEEAAGKQQAQEFATRGELREALEQGLKESREKAGSLSRRTDDLNNLLATTSGDLSQKQEQLSTRASELTSGQQALAVKQNRLLGGLLATALLIIALGLLGYWLNGKRLEQTRTASQREFEEIRQQVMSLEQGLTQQRAAAEPVAGLDELRTQVIQLESRFERQQQRLGLLEDQAREGSTTTQSAGSNLQQVLERQEQLISSQQEEMYRLAQDLQQLEMAQQETAELLHELALKQSQLLSTRSSMDPATRPGVDGQGKTLLPSPAQADGRSLDRLLGSPWLSELNADHFTIQLVAAYNPAVIERVANDHGLTGKLAHYTWKYQGRDWNVLLYGDFPTRELALAARRELPDEIKAFGPWIRRLAWVHRQLTDR